MEEEGEVVGGGGIMSKMMKMNKNSKGGDNGEVDYKDKAGTAWSHSYLNQKPWHPLSYPNQRRKWIAEQTDAQRQRRAEDVAREFAQEQEFFRQSALISKKEKEKVETMKAVSFMYVRPPGYNPESAKAAELEDERKRLGLNNPPTDSSAMPPESSMPGNDCPTEEKMKPRPRDVFGRALPTEQEFQVLKNAPRLETGMPARVKPFGVEVRNVKCARCGAYGHQSGDRECPLKDAIMPNEENRLKRDDPLTAILAQTDTSEPLKWELKQKPGMSPPRGGFKPDDPNQQIVAEDIFDEYGGFLSGGIPNLLSNFSAGKPKKRSKSKSKRKHKSQSLATNSESRARPKKRPSSPSASNGYREKRLREEKMKGKKCKKKKRHNSGLDSSDSSDSNRHHKRNKRQFSELSSSDNSDSDRHHKRSKHRHHRRRHHHQHHHQHDYPHHRRCHGNSS